MVQYLLSIVLPAGADAVAERVVRSAVAFLETQGGAVERADLGTFTRSVRTSAEVLRLVQLCVDVAPDGTIERTNGRALESMLRSALGTTGVRDGDVRVFVAAPLKLAA